MLAYQRRARWIRRMQERANRRREREWSQRAGFASASSSQWVAGDSGSPRAA